MVPKKVSENYSFLNIVLLQLGHWQLYLLSLDPLLSSIPKNSSNIQSGTPYSYPHDSHFISISTSSSINASSSSSVYSIIWRLFSFPEVF